MACNHNKKVWTAQELARVIEMRHAGFSAREIGLQFGVSRNAICGVVNRNKNVAGPLPAKVIKRPVLVAFKWRRVWKGGAYDKQRQEALALEPLGAGPFAELGRCKFIGSAHDTCCDRPVTRPKSSWCEAHRYAVFQPGKVA